MLKREKNACVDMHTLIRYFTNNYIAKVDINKTYASKSLKSQMIILNYI